MIKIFRENHFSPTVFQTVAHQPGQISNHLLCGRRIETTHVADVLKRVIEEMRIELGLKLFVLRCRHKLCHLARRLALSAQALNHLIAGICNFGKIRIRINPDLRLKISALNLPKPPQNPFTIFPSLHFPLSSKP